MGGATARLRTTLILSIALLSIAFFASSANAQVAKYNCTFDSTSCGFDLAPSGGVLNVTTNTIADLNGTSYTWQNYSMYIYCPANALGFKFGPSTGTGSDRWLWECDGVDCNVKNEDSYSLDLAGFPINALTYTQIAFNRSANSTTIDWAGKGSTSSANNFNILSTNDNTQFETSYSGSDCYIENMTMYVLDAEENNSNGAVWNQTYPLLNASEIGFNSQNRSNNYDELVDSLYANGNVTQVISSQLWVPWYTSSTACGVSDLKSGADCSIGTPNMTLNCMVSDEFSEVGIMVSMSANQTRMEQFKNTVVAINSSHGQIPAWKLYRNNTLIRTCIPSFNSNCDTASDATARIIIALFNGANNTFFTNQTQKTGYFDLGKNITRDMLLYEVKNECHDSHLGLGQICYWLGGGYNVTQSGIGSTDFGFTSYYPDAIMAFYQACVNTGNATYCAVAGNLTLNYLQAAYPPGTNWSTSGFRAPPGKSFNWANTSTIPYANCTSSCSPIAWGSVDEPRALQMCELNYWTRRISMNTTALETYCRNLGNQHFNATASTPLSFYPNGTNSSAYVNSFFAQGLASLHQMGGHDQTKYSPTLDSALGHYSSGTRTWDSTSCFGVYDQSRPVRSLGEGIGRSLPAWPSTYTLFYDPTPTITLRNVTVSPTTAYKNSTLLGYANATSSVGSVTFTCDWLKNGIANVTFTTGSLSQGVLHNVGNFSTNFTRADVIILQCNATDGANTTAKMNSSSLTIANTPPVVTQSLTNYTSNRTVSSYASSVYCRNASNDNIISGCTNATDTDMSSFAYFGPTSHGSDFNYIYANFTVPSNIEILSASLRFKFEVNEPSVLSVFHKNTTGGRNILYYDFPPITDDIEIDVPAIAFIDGLVRIDVDVPVSLSGGSYAKIYGLYLNYTYRYLNASNEAQLFCTAYDIDGDKLSYVFNASKNGAVYLSNYTPESESKTMPPTANYSTSGILNANATFTDDGISASTSSTGYTAVYGQFGLNLSDTVDILGIQLNYNVASNSSDCFGAQKMGAYLSNNGGSTYGSYVSGTIGCDVSASPTFEYGSLGSSTALWGLSWNYSSFNNSNFYVQLQPQAVASYGMVFVDYFNITVFYRNATHTQNVTVNVANLTTSQHAHNDSLSLTCLASDGQSSSSLTGGGIRVEDSTIPNISSPITQPTSISVGASILLAANFTDDDVLSVTNVTVVAPTQTYSYAMSLLSGNNYTKTFTDTSSAGNYTVSYTAIDSAGNSVSLAGSSFAASTGGSGGGDTGGGGGGAPPTITVINQNANATVPVAFCGNNVCDESTGENPSACFEDCPVNVDTVFSCLFSDDPEQECIYGSEWFISFLIFFIVGTVVFFVYKESSNTKKRKPQEVRRG